jgi:hypothetical protein
MAEVGVESIGAPSSAGRIGGKPEIVGRSRPGQRDKPRNPFADILGMMDNLRPPHVRPTA